jgi:hypothetical protein
LPRIEEGGGSWLRRPNLYKRVAEPHKNKNKNKKKRYTIAVDGVMPLT